MTQIILTSGTSYTTPPDWNPSANTIEVIGGGQNGGATAGGNGADYAKVSNVSLSGAIAYAIGQPGTTGGDTTFGSVLLAKGGGSASADIGSTTYAGGTGNAAGGGGGAAGPSGVGGNAPGAAGGTGNNGTVAADTSGTEWGTAGSGGGGTYVPPSSGLSIVQSSNASSASNGNQTFNSGTGWATPTAGNLLIFFPLTNAGAPYTTPSGWNVFLNTSASPRTILAYWMNAAGTESTLTVPFSTGAATLLEISGANASPVNGADNVYSGTASSTHASPALTPTVGKTLAIAGIWPNATNDAFTSSGAFTDLPKNTGRVYYNFHLAYALQDSSLSSVTDTFTSSTASPAAGTMLILVSPA